MAMCIMYMRLLFTRIIQYNNSSNSRYNDYDIIGTHYRYALADILLSTSFQ